MRVKNALSITVPPHSISYTILTSEGNHLYFTFKKNIEIHMSSHQYLDDINYSTPNELDEVTKIQYHVDNIRSQAKIEMILEIS